VEISSGYSIGTQPAKAVFCTSTATANSFLAQADALTAAGNYKSAYQYYRKAYKPAVN
jgi:hypothetical protein